MFTEQELAEVRLCASGRVPFWQAFEACASSGSPVGKRCADAKRKLEEWRELSKVTPLGTFMFHLAGDSLHYAMAGASPAGHTARKNIRLLCMQADEVRDAGIYTIRDFLSYAADQASGGDTRAAAPLAENDDVIRIMTMHKSKGLQFPVVFCLGLDREMKGKQDAPVLTDAELGIALRYKDGEQRISRKTAADEIFTWKKEQEERAERIRLLYVAMTRAQKRMFLAGITEDRLNWQLMTLGIFILIGYDVMRSRGIRAGEMIRAQETWFKWAVWIIGLIIVLTCGIWGPGYDAASFIYSQF
jgi:ATP-dependent helicase/nuclease subunit A